VRTDLIGRGDEAVLSTFLLVCALHATARTIESAEAVT
jgi:hypothetical protein